MAPTGSIPHSHNHNADRTRLIPLKRGHFEYFQVKQLFRKGWKHPDKDRPRVHAVFKVVMPQVVLKPYLDYKSAVSRSSMRPDGRIADETLLFHGTTRACLLGEDSRRIQLCSLPECSLCCIIHKSFSIKKCGSRHKFKRFGMGIYTTSCSSKADDYSRNKSQKAILRVLLVNRVVVGKPHKSRHNAKTLKRPPAGYHSVIGEPGMDLNYEETIVYRNDAIRPAYLVVYGKHPQGIDKLRQVLTTLFNTPAAA